MKSICILLQNHYDRDIRVRRKAEALVAAGYSVDVYALRFGDGEKNYKLNGVNVYTLSLSKQRGSLARYFFEYVAFFLWCLVSVTIQTRRKGYLLIDVNTLPDFLIFAGVFARWMGAKLVLDMHEITPEFYMSKYEIREDSWLVRLLTYVERISFNFADHVMTINEPIQDLLFSRGLPASKSTILMNSADEGRFAWGPAQSAAAEAAAANAQFVMMYHGTLTRLYGLDIAIEAFAMVQKDMPGAEFWILGDGPEVPVLKELSEKLGVQDKVKLTGFVKPAEINAWLRKCDLGILPIRRDVFLEYASPNKLAEFIVMGKPVVISRLRAIKHYFSANALAYFEPNDAADLGRRMLELYRDQDLRNRMVAAARQEYAPIRWEVMKRRYLTLIEKLVGLPPARQQVWESDLADAPDEKSSIGL
jgi:glycosyltransferase involved in cell wall biosynthesis